MSCSHAPIRCCLLLVASTLAACGGGGSSGSQAAPPAPTPGGSSPTPTPTPTPTPATYSVGGTISGLTTAGLILRNAGVDLTIAANSTSFEFNGKYSSGAAYDVQVVQQPAGQVCAASGASGSVASSPVTTVSVVCSAIPTQGGLAIDKTSLSFAGEEGQFVPAQSIVGAINGATGTVFLRIAYTTQGVDTAVLHDLTPTSGELTVTPKQPVRLGPGTYSDTLTVTACFDDPCTRHLQGSPKVVPITYTVTRTPARVLQLSDHGVAFAAVPQGQHLTRAITIVDPTSSASTWTATGASSWLSVTASGSSGDAMTLSADVTGLADGFYEQTVMITSSNPLITAPENVRVGLYISHSASSAELQHKPPAPIIGNELEPATSVADPIRPLLYTAIGTQVSVDHVYTGAHLADIDIPAVTSLGDVVVDQRGSRLYVLGRLPITSITIVDLQTLAVVDAYDFEGEYTFPVTGVERVRIVGAHQGGRFTLLFNGAQSGLFDGPAPVVDADTGQTLGALNNGGGGFRALNSVSRDGRSLYTVETGLSGSLSVWRGELRANVLGNVYGVRSAETVPQTRANAREIAASTDGSKVFASFFDDNFGSMMEARYTGTNVLSAGPGIQFTLPGNVLSVGITPRNVEFDPYGRLLANLGTMDVRLYGADGVLIQQVSNLPDQSIGSAGTGLLRVSSDGLRAIGNGYLMDLVP